MNALLLCKVWSKAIALIPSAPFKNSEELALDLINDLQQENLSKKELKLTIAYVARNFNVIEDLIYISDRQITQFKKN